MIDWNSLDSVSRVHYWIQGAAVALGFLAAVLYVVSLITQNRMNALQSDHGMKQESRLKAAEENSQRLQKDLEEARKKQLLAQEELKRVRDQSEATSQEAKKLTEKHRPRSLSQDQRTKIVGYLKRYPGRSIVVTRIFGDPETNRYGEQITSILEEGRWNLTVNLAGTLFPQVYGLLLRLPDPNNPPEAASILIKAFQNGNLEVSLQQDPNRVELVIGHKPPGWEWN